MLRSSPSLHRDRVLLLHEISPYSLASCEVNCTCVCTNGKGSTHPIIRIRRKIADRDQSKSRECRLDLGIVVRWDRVTAYCYTEARWLHLSPPRTSPTMFSRRSRRIQQNSYWCVCKKKTTFLGCMLLKDCPQNVWNMGLFKIMSIL